MNVEWFFLFMIFMGVLVVAMVVALIVILRPRRARRGFPVTMKPDGSVGSDEAKRS